MRKFYIFCIAACCFAVGVSASEHNFVRVAHAKGSQTEKPEFKSLLAKAEKGDAKAQFKVGVKYSLGEDVPQDSDKAVKWYKKAAKKGEPLAQNNLAALYMKGKDKDGKGVAKDVKKGLTWYKKAAEQGSTVALNNLAVHYLTGTGVPQDTDKAVEYFTKAAELGDEMAKDYLKGIKKAAEEKGGEEE
ncbi:MAG: sel1 repeat family protein [Alphaproteobacteria bacterium]|nr:sel1 repeat family protein [Alphaproteobacteria bacterium]